MVKNNVRENTAVAQEMQTSFRRYKNPTETGTFQNARLSSAPQHFGGVVGGNITSSKMEVYVMKEEFQLMLSHQVVDASLCLEEKHLQSNFQEHQKARKLLNMTLLNTFFLDTRNHQLKGPIH